MEHGEVDIQGLIEASAQGDRAQFKELYDHLVGRVFAYVRSRTARQEHATDLTQDVFIDLWQALPRFAYRSREQFYAYVFVITRRTLARHYGKEQKAPYSLDATELDVPDEHVADVELTDTFERALELLEPVTRDIVVLHHWSRYTFGEIAAMLHMKETAVRVRHHRALKALQAHIHHT